LGYLLPSEADSIRALAQARNSLIHGHLSASVSAAEVSHFAEILENLATEVAKIIG
jgi:hypothetical protein